MQTEIVTLADARQRGSQHYCTGRPCVNGHLSARFVSSRGCVECARAQTQRWREANPEASLLLTRKSVTKWRKADPARARQVDRDHYLANKAVHARQKQAAYSRNAIEIRAKVAEWQRANVDKVKAVKARRRANKQQATPQWYDPVGVEGFYETARGVSMLTGEWFHVDHVVPLKSPLFQSLSGNLQRRGEFIGPLLPVVQGFHCSANLEVISMSDNSRKGNRTWPYMPKYETN